MFRNYYFYFINWVVIEWMYMYVLFFLKVIGYENLS